MFRGCVCFDPDKRVQRHDTRTAGLFQSLENNHSRARNQRYST